MKSNYPKNKKRVYSIAITVLVIFSIVALVCLKLVNKPSIRNVILISIDTCRADYLSCYGFAGNTTPAIDAIARDGVLFENVTSPVPLTLPAHSSMLTGTTPLYHGVHDNLEQKLDESHITIAEILKEYKFETAAIISAFVLDSQFGTDQGFDYYNDQFVEPIPSIYQNERRGEEASRFACEYLDRHHKEPFFLFLHY